MDSSEPDAVTAQARGLWDEAAPDYGRLAPALLAVGAQELVDFAGIRRGWRVLDVACGAGLAGLAAARRAGTQGSVLAVDLSPRMLALAQAQAPAKGAAPLSWRVMDAHRLEVPDASFEAVLCHLGLMLFARPQEALQEMRRAAAPGAPVVCLVEGRRSAMLFSALLYDALLQRAPQLRRAAGAGAAFAFGPDKILEEAFSRAGLTEIVARRLSGCLRFSTPEEYWAAAVALSGRTGVLLRAQAPETQAKVRSDVLRRAAKLRDGTRLAIPFEFTLARGVVSALR